jgi:prevent-host-death family protein
MEKLTANQAKTNFGQLLMKAQSEPVQIDKNGKPVAVVVSIEDYQATEELKLQMLKDIVKKAENEIKNGTYTDDADEFFNHLLSTD